MDRRDLARRLKAARALGGFGSPLALAQHPLLAENHIKEWRIRHMESVEADVEIRPIDLEVIARACELPAEFFSAPFERLARNVSLSERMEAVERELRLLRERAPDPEALLAEARRQADEDAAAADRQRSTGQKPSG